MSQGTEEIEGKLAAYVDGTLDDAGRAEIERHLASNPAHAQLLADLVRGREMLTSLPREPAPPEIIESLQSQLERRLLLDESAVESVSAKRVRSWSRRLALAAVLALSATLVLVVYSVLPSPRQRSDELVALERAESMRSEEIPSVVAGTGREATPSPTPSGPGGLTGGPVVSVVPSTDPTVTPVVPPTSIPDRPALVSAASTPAEVLLLLTDDPVTAESDLRSVLVENRLEFATVNDTAARDEAGGMARSSITDAHDSASRLRSGEPAAGVPLGESARGTEHAPVDKSESDPDEEIVYVVRNVPRSQLETINHALQRKQQARGPAAQVAQQWAPPPQQKFYNDVAQAKLQAPARQVAASEQNRLGRSVNGRVVGQEQSFQSPVGEHGLPDSVGIIAAGESLLIRLPVELPSGEVTPVEQPVTVSSEGEIELAKTPPIQALGLTPAELERRIAEELRRKDLPDPQVRVRRAPAIAFDRVSEPATQPGAAEPDAAPPAPAGQPDASPEAPASDDLTDLVIVVRQQPSHEEALPGARTADDEPSPVRDPAGIPATRPAAPLFVPTPATQPATAPSGD